MISKTTPKLWWSGIAMSNTVSKTTVSVGSKLFDNAMKFYLLWACVLQLWNNINKTQEQIESTESSKSYILRSLPNRWKIEPIIGLRCTQRNPNPRVNGWWRNRGLPSSWHNPEVEISRSTSETDHWLFFLPVLLKIEVLKRIFTINVVWRLRTNVIWRS